MKYVHSEVMKNQVGKTFMCILFNNCTKKDITGSTNDLVWHFKKKMRASVQENKTSETSHVSCMNNTAWKKSIVAYGLIAVQVTN